MKHNRHNRNHQQGGKSGDTMQLKVVKWLKHVDAHKCIAINGRFPDGQATALVDVQTGSETGDSIQSLPPESLVGKTIECDFVHTYMYIASGSKLESKEVTQ